MSDNTFKTLETIGDGNRTKMSKEKAAKNASNLKVLCSGDSVLPINEFRLRKMQHYATICMIAKRGSGKSWIVRELLYHYRDIPVGTIICPTDKMSKFYGIFFADLYIHYDYSSELIQGILLRQDKMIEKYNEYLAKKRVVDPRAFIIMDDCLADEKAWVNDKFIRELLMNGRHYKVMYILTMQAPLGIKPQLRNQFDYVFLLFTDKVAEQKKIYDHYAGMFPTFDAFRQVYSGITKDFGAMVINNRGNMDNFLEKVYWYKARKLDDTDVTIGCKQFNKAHELNFNKNWSKGGRLIDINNLTGKKQKISVAKRSKGDVELE